MNRTSKPATTAIYRRSQPVEDRAYCRFICRLFCLVCGVQYGLEGAHTGGRGLGQRTSDRSRIPLCHKHHRTGNDSLHRLGPVKFAEVHKIDILAIVESLNTRYDARIARSINS